MDPHVELQDWWRRTNAGVMTAEIPDGRIAEFERRYELTLPDDFRTYLRLGSPVHEAWDASNSSWWTFERIKNIPNEYPHDLGPGIEWRTSKYLFFADHAIWCWAWAISCAEDATRGNVVVIGGVHGHRVVAQTFSDFVANYVKDWAAVS